MKNANHFGPPQEPPTSSTPPGAAGAEPGDNPRVRVEERHERIERISEAFERIFYRGSLLLTGISLVAALAQWTFQDRYPILRTIFYALPRPLLAILFLILAIWWLSQARLPLGVLCLAGAVAFTFSWRVNDFSATTVAGCEGVKPIRIVFWNVARPGELPEIRPRLEEIRRLDPDIIAIVEATTEVSITADRPADRAKKLGKAFRDEWSAALTGYQYRILPDGMVIAAKGTVRLVGWEELGKATRLATAQVVTRDGIIRLLLADVDANPFLSRAPILHAIEKASRNVREPVIVAGDFNTPRDSVQFDMLERSGFSQAFELAGSGHRSTWPVPVPLMALDHVWLRGIEPCTVELEQSELSDHKRIVVDLRPRVTRPGRSPR